VGRQLRAQRAEHRGHHRPDGVRPDLEVSRDAAKEFGEAERFAGRAGVYRTSADMGHDLRRKRIENEPRLLEIQARERVHTTAETASSTSIPGDNVALSRTARKKSSAVPCRGDPSTDVLDLIHRHRFSCVPSK